MTAVVWIVRVGLAGVFAVAGGAKLGDHEGARRTARGLGVPPAVASAAAIVVSVAELAAAVLLLVWPRVGALLAVTLLGVFFVALAGQLARGVRVPCACFGRVASAPAGLPTLARNLALAAAALFVLSQT